MERFEKWWVIYQESELDALEDKLNVSNQNIAQSYDNSWLPGLKSSSAFQLLPDGQRRGIVCAKPARLNRRRASSLSMPTEQQCVQPSFRY